MFLEYEDTKVIAVCLQRMDSRFQDTLDSSR